MASSDNPQPLDQNGQTKDDDGIYDRIYIGGILGTAMQQALEVECKRFGTVTDVWVTHNLPGFGFVQFNDPDAASKAVEALNGNLFRGVKLRVELSKKPIQQKGGKSTYSSQKAQKPYSRPYKDDRRPRKRPLIEDRPPSETWWPNPPYSHSSGWRPRQDYRFPNYDEDPHYGNEIDGPVFDYDQNVYNYDQPRPNYDQNRPNYDQNRYNYNQNRYNYNQNTYNYDYGNYDQAHNDHPPESDLGFAHRRPKPLMRRNDDYTSRRMPHNSNYHQEMDNYRHPSNNFY